MDIEQKGIFLLIKSALTGEKFDLPAGFDFDKACHIAKMHGASALIYYGALNCGFDANSAQMQNLFFMTATHISVNERQLFMIKKIFDAFEKNAIDYLPLKGITLQKFYPKAGMRVMGDADILIRTEQYSEIKEIMLSLGFKAGEVSDHEIKWSHESLFVELHSKLIPSYNTDYYEYFGDGWQLAKEKDGTDYRYKMVAEDELIYLFTHFAKHYRDTGIGIKHFLDIWVFLQNHKSMNTDYIENELKKLRLYDFYVNVLNTFYVWFGNCAANEKTELITRVIFKSGASGNYESAVLSSALKVSKNSKKVPRIQKIYKTIFKPFDIMCKKYDILKKCPVLLPVFWIANILEVFKRKSVTTVFEDFKAISKQSVENYKESLNFVGLDFNFKE